MGPLVGETPTSLKYEVPDIRELSFFMGRGRLSVTDDCLIFSAPPFGYQKKIWPPLWVPKKILALSPLATGKKICPPLSE